MNYNSDDLIIAEIRKHNQMALRELYRAHYPMVRNLITNNSGSEQEAKDVYQEAVIVFYEKLQRADFVLTCKIKTYLYAVCRRLWLKRLAEKKMYTGNIESLETFLGVEDEVNDVEEKALAFKKMQVALGGLGEPCKTIITDFYIGDLGMEEIAIKFGYTNSDNAKNQKYKCLQRLKKLFFADDKRN
ncbi:RNA polymerase sigma factor [Pseudochryseolinea flava]|uniref:Sigma-70 family RNA polymerase sigma factor n=1 Tax=Pseudochryseolinea flava TaxID=2059302 RepID=A0A364XYT2_9BACT|nr:sigma-70 family RNA polymerase sigma factor [Pseudochryseolinea flava]RAV98755.1 sigma-70 family RNA polymerase sigma factor [Pseudochryseolinea flava]